MPGRATFARRGRALEPLVQAGGLVCRCRGWDGRTRGRSRGCTWWRGGALVSATTTRWASGTVRSDCAGLRLAQLAAAYDAAHPEDLVVEVDFCQRSAINSPWRSPVIAAVRNSTRSVSAQVDAVGGRGGDHAGELVHRQEPDVGVGLWGAGAVDVLDGVVRCQASLGGEGEDRAEQVRLVRDRAVLEVLELVGEEAFDVARGDASRITSWPKNGRKCLLTMTRWSSTVWGRRALTTSRCSRCCRDDGKRRPGHGTWGIRELLFDLAAGVQERAWPGSATGLPRCRDGGRGPSVF